MYSAQRTIELKIACRNLINSDLSLSKKDVSDPAVFVYVCSQMNPAGRLIGKTERMKNTLNPNFMQTVAIPSRSYNQNDTLSLRVFDIDDNRSWFSRSSSQPSAKDDYLGQVAITIREILDSNGQDLEKRMDESGAKKGVQRMGRATRRHKKRKGKGIMYIRDVACVPMQQSSMPAYTPQQEYFAPPSQYTYDPYGQGGHMRSQTNWTLVIGVACLAAASGVAAWMWKSRDERR